MPGNQEPDGQSVLSLIPITGIIRGKIFTAGDCRFATISSVMSASALDSNHSVSGAGMTAPHRLQVLNS